MDETMLERLSKYEHSDYDDDCLLMAERLIAIGGLSYDGFVTDGLKAALHQLLTNAQNPCNKDYHRILWNVLVAVVQDKHGEGLTGAAVARGDWDAANRFLELYDSSFGAPRMF